MTRGALLLLLAMSSVVSQETVADAKKRARALLAEDRAAEALVLLDRARSAAPQDVDVMVHRGDALFLLERYADAVASFEAAVARDPGVEPFVVNFGAALLRLGRAHDALRRSSVVAEKGPSPALRARGLAGAGLARLDLGDTKAAREAFEAAVKLDGGVLKARYQLALLLLKSGDAAGAVEQLNAVVAKEPLFDGAAYNLALAYAAAKDDARAAAWREKFARFRRLKNGIDGLRLTLRAFPDDAAAWLSLARLYVEAESPRDAAAAYTRVVALKPDDRSALVEYASLCDKTGDKEKAATLRARAESRK